MSTYQLFPGLKQILEDKRIRQYGVPALEKDAYLRAESFVLDVRGMTQEEMNGIAATFTDLKEMELDKPPCDKFIIYALSDAWAPSPPGIISAFYNANSVAYGLHENEASAAATQRECKTNAEYAEGRSRCFSGLLQTLIVFLATRAIQKEHHAAPKNRLAGAKPHKKGTGGYTVIRPPSHRENGGEETGITVRPHFRRGHIRKLHPEDKTCWVWVSSCFVNGVPEVQRKAYLVQNDAA